MYVSSLAIDQFGESQNLRIDDWTPGLNVVYGASRAGKTTLFDFLRAQLFGFSSALSRRYRVWQGGRCGGSVTLREGANTRTLSRYDELLAGPLPPGSSPVASDSLAWERNLCGSVPPGFAEQIYFVTPQESPALAALLGQAAAAGFDCYATDAACERREYLRRRLAELHRAEADTPGPTEPRAALLQRRELLLAEISRAEVQAAAWQAAAAKRARQAGEIADLERRLHETQHEIQRLEQAQVQIEARRASWERELAALPTEVPENIPATSERLQRWQRTLDEIQELRRQRMPDVEPRWAGLAPSERVAAEPGTLAHSLERAVQRFQQQWNEITPREYAGNGPTCACQANHAAGLRLTESLLTELRQLAADAHARQWRLQQQLADYEHEQLAACEQHLENAISLAAEWPQPFAGQPEIAGSRQRSIELRQLLEECLAQRGCLARERGACEERRQTLLRQIAELRAYSPAHEELAPAPTVPSLRERLARIERSLAEWGTWQTRRDEIQEAERELASLPAPREGIVDRASGHLRSLSQGVWTRLEGQTEGTVWLENAAGQRQALASVPLVARQQAQFALAVALAEAGERRGCSLPLVFDGTPAAQGLGDVEHFLEWLHGVAGVRQIICCTGDERYLHAARRLGLRVGSLRATQAEVPQMAAPFRPNSWDAEEFPGELEDRVRAVGLADATSPSVAVRSFVNPGAATAIVFDERPVLEGRDYRDTETTETSGPALAACSESQGVECLDFLASAQCAALQGIGVRTVGEFLAADPEMLAQRLRATGMQRSDWEQRQRRARRRVRRARHSGVRSAVRALSPQQPPDHQPRGFVAPSHARTREREPSRQGTARYRLHAQSPVVDAPTIGPTLAKKLAAVEILSVANLLNANPDDLATRLQASRIKPETVRQWQQQALLCCEITNLHGHDAQLLVAAGVTSAEQVARQRADDLWRLLSDCARTPTGSRLLRGAEAPEREEVAQWIDSARERAATSAA